MAANSKILAQAAVKLCIQKHEKQDVAYGNCNGFTVLVYGTGGTPQTIGMAVCASANGQPVNREWLAGVQLPKKVSCSINQYRVNLSFPVSGNVNANVERIEQCLGAITSVLNSYGCVNCDETGVPGIVEAYNMKGAYVLLSPQTAATFAGSLQQGAEKEAVKNENYVGGIIGALLGSVVGMLAILLIAQLGRIAVIGGIVMGFGIVYGYKKLGKKFSLFSLIICIALSILMTFLTCQLSSTIDILKSVGGSDDFWYCFTHVQEIYEWSDSLDAYFHNTILMMIVGVAGTGVIAFAEYSGQKEQFQLYKL